MFALVDCNNFYASCERVFDPRLANKALVILSNNDGCVIARSNEAKKLGVKMGQPVFEIKELITAGIVQVRSSNFSLYADMSYRVMQTLSQFGYEMEVYSIDEVFMSLTCVKSSDLKSVGKQIQEKIEIWTGLPVSVGIGTTKTLAKVAGRLAKDGSNARVLIDKGEIDSVLAKTSLEDVWGVGKRSGVRLKRASIHNAIEFRSASHIMIRKILGVAGLRVNLELNGVCSLSLDSLPSPKKSILSSRSFGKAVDELAQLEEAVANFTAKAAKKLRKERKFAAFISVFVATGALVENHYANHLGISLTSPSSYTPDLITIAKKCLKKIYRPGILYKKAGVMLSDFSNQSDFQKDLFENSDYNKKEKLMKLVDQVNIYYGKKALFFTAEGTHNNWKSIQANMSPKYTTCWDQILKVN